MTVDFRARLICSIGSVIEGSISRNHINDGSGLQMVSGTIVLNGLRVPPRGASVELAYEVPQDGTVTRFPHPLRVLKAQAEPQAHRTTVEVGCLLKLMSDKVDPAAAFLATQGTPVYAWDIMQTITRGANYPIFYRRQPILAQEALEYCLAQVAIKLDPASVPLQFPFLRWKLDLSAGFVKVIGDLLRSERCFGYLNQQERLVVERVPTRATMGVGVVISRSKLAELQPITGGEEPAERYRVRYRSNELPLWVDQDGSRPSSQWMVGRALAQLEADGPYEVFGRALAITESAMAPSYSNTAGNLLQVEENLGFLVPQSVSVEQARSYTLSFYGTGSAVLSGVAAATVSGEGVFPARAQYTFRAAFSGALAVSADGSVRYPVLTVAAVEATSPVWSADQNPPYQWPPSPVAQAINSAEVANGKGVSLAGVTEDYDSEWSNVAYLLQFASETEGEGWSKDPPANLLVGGTNFVDDPPYGGTFRVFPVVAGDGSSPTAKAWAYGSREPGAGVDGGDAVRFIADPFMAWRQVPQLEISAASAIGAGQDFTAEGWSLIQVPGTLNSVVRLWCISSVDHSRAYDSSHALSWCAGQLYWKPGAASLFSSPPGIYGRWIPGTNRYAYLNKEDVIDDGFRLEDPVGRFSRVLDVPANQLFHWCVQRTDGLIRVAANGRWSESFTQDARSFVVDQPGDADGTYRHFVGSGELEWASADLFYDIGPGARRQSQLVGLAAEVRLTIGASRYDTTRPFVRPAGQFVASGS